MPKDSMDKKKAVKAARTAGSAAVGALSLALKIVVTALLVILTTSLLFVCIFAFYVKTTLVDDLDISLDDFSLSESSTVYDINGDVMATLSSGENRIWVDYEDIPEDLEHALVAIEDKRFYEHKGVDWYRTVGAIFSSFLGSSSFGGSTITQQLIKNLTGDNEVTVQRKLVEIFRALEFEKKYDKEEIIEWYLNAVFFGEGCNGIYTAAQTYFGKEPSELTLAECASIVGIVNLPTYYSPFYSLENNKKRQETVLREMYEQGYITYDEYTQAVNEELVFTRSPSEVASTEIYSYYVEAVIDDVTADLMEVRGINYETATRLLYSGGYQIYTCCDSRIQEIAENYYENLDNFPNVYPRTTQQLQSAIVIMDQYTGNIVAMVGGVGEKNANLILNRATDTTRAPGSSLKPLSVYAPGFDLGIITQNTLVIDGNPADPGYTLEHFSWYPRNASLTYTDGPVTIRKGLISSLNTVAVQILDKLGLETSYSYLEDVFGFTTLVDADYNPSPLALGELTYGVTVREMTQAFSALANGGTFSESRTYSQVVDSNGNVVLDNPVQQRQAIRENAAWNVVDMMVGSANGGTSTSANFYTQEVAGKTGSSGNNRDRWFVGMTPYYVAAVWTGHDIPVDNGVTWSNPACVIWRNIMQQVHEGLEYRSFTDPTSIGGDTQIFGDLTTPTPTPTETPTPSASDTPDATLPPDDGEDIVPTEPVDEAA
ncbi:MAG TPA: PBP1A family penicillin-binding protein [Candidatus Scatomorpha pullicola]|nr:PBP1A family penicillin-binding protein [Candidatus Scatomorpha pullicola]